MDSWADVEEAVTGAIYDAAWENFMRGGSENSISEGLCNTFARAAIIKIRELRLTAAVPDA